VTKYDRNNIRKNGFNLDHGFSDVSKSWYKEYRWSRKRHIIVARKAVKEI
jgi:hypothetical protein